MSNLRWIEGTTTAGKFLESIVGVITQGEGNNYWDLVYPESINKISDKAIISTKPFEDDEDGSDKEFYLMLEKPLNPNFSDTDEEDELEESPYKLNYILLSIGDRLNDSGNGLDKDSSSVKTKYAWYRDYEDVEGLYFGDWLPIMYYMNIDKKTINLVVQGDPSIDVRPYKNALFSYAYIGAIDSYEGGDNDTRGNFALTVGSHESPNKEMKFGANTGNGVLDIIMAYSRAGAPYQAHDIKFKADNPYKDKYFIGPSTWTHKFHFDEPTIIHKYDRERGKLRNVLIGDRSALENNAELIYKKGTDEQRVYKSYQISSPYWFVEESANPLYGVILRKE